MLPWFKKTRIQCNWYNLMDIDGNVSASSCNFQGHRNLGPDFNSPAAGRCAPNRPNSPPHHDGWAPSSGRMRIYQGRCGRVCSYIPLIYPCNFLIYPNVECPIPFSTCGSLLWPFNKNMAGLKLKPTWKCLNVPAVLSTSVALKGQGNQEWRWFQWTKPYNIPPSPPKTEGINRLPMHGP
jgi:hypothetical protein